MAAAPHAFAPSLTRSVNIVKSPTEATRSGAGKISYDSGDRID
jgi:hypothetical protein